MDKKLIAALGLGAVLGGGATMGAEALAKVEPSQKVLKAELLKRELSDGGISFIERISLKNEKTGQRSQQQGIVTDPKQLAVCDDYWKAVVERPDLLTVIPPPLARARDAGR